MTQQQKRSDLIILQMGMMIEQSKIELMARHGKDLIVIDRDILASLENSKAVLAWCVGHAHTHLAVLGLHPAENSMVNTHVRLASEDKFYKLVLKQGMDFSLQELTRIEYVELGDTPVPYTVAGDKLDFTLFKAGAPLAHVNIKPVSVGMKRHYQIQYRPIKTLLEIDKRAAETWAHKSVNSYANTLFTTISDEIWHATEQEKKMALTLLEQYQTSNKVSALYQNDAAFANALAALFPRFDYANFCHLTVAELKRLSLAWL